MNCGKSARQTVREANGREPNRDRLIRCRSRPRTLLTFACLVLLATSKLAAQVKPNADWRTLRTEHFSVHFTPALETIARRAATDAEFAYAELSRHLHPPRGPIDIVISDDVDFTNGSATPVPSNRIVVYANPPVFENALRFIDDPTALIVTHELTHIFHLDRATGVWGVLQKFFGRVPVFFPNGYQPAWLVEGLAVYYETQITGSGRIAGSEHRMIARTAALSGVFPRIDQLSLARPHFPYGYSAYAYGSLFMDYLGRTHGDSAMRAFVEASSRQLVPLLLNGAARRAFGRSFTREYSAWVDSLTKHVPSVSPTLPGWRDLTVEGAYANFPRWLNDTSLAYVGTPGRESFGAYRVDIDARRTSRSRIGRRNSRSPNSVLSDGSLLYSQLDYTSPYEVRSDLYIDNPRGRSTRLTRNARLAYPDARADGLIVAVHTLPAGTQLALVSANTKTVTPLTSGGPDEHWTEARWSPDGKHIAASHWLRGGTSEIVVIDTTGRIEQTLISERAVNSTPTWAADGRYVYFVSDRTGISNLYRGAFRAAFADTMMVPDLQRVSDVESGLFEPETSPNGRTLAAVVFRADGYHVGIAPVDSLRTQNANMQSAAGPRTANLEPPTAHTGPSTSYSPWRSLVPRYWLPFADASLGNGTRIGAITSGEDVVGRHGYVLLAEIPTDNSGIVASAYYRNARLGLPIVEVAASQDWTNLACVNDQAQAGNCVGLLRRRIRDASASLSFVRQRMRTGAYVSIGGGVEAREYATDTPSLLQRIDSFYQRRYFYPRATASLGWSNVQYPLTAISPEDGISLASTLRYRRRQYDSTSGSTSFVSAVAGYKSVPLPGYAHHVLAVNGAYGMMDNRGSGYFEVGGVSGGVLNIVPGYELGEGRHTFGVRGFPAATLLGIRAASGSAEYRLPLALPGRGSGTLPLFLDRVSGSLFTDAGTAWCPAVFFTRPPPTASLCTLYDYENRFVFTTRQLLLSAGAEVSISAAILSWDAPFRSRLGVAVPIVGNSLVRDPKPVSAYFAIGAAF